MIQTLSSQTTSSNYNVTRIYELDIAKVVGMFFVVLGHTYSNSGADLSLRAWIYSFHMPLFFLISGILHKEKKSVSITLRYYFKTLLVPVIVFGLLYFLLYVPFSYYGLCIYNNDMSEIPISNQQSLYSYVLAFLNYVLLGIFTGTSLPDLVLWFLVVLFLCKVWILAFNRYRTLTVFVYICLCVVFFGFRCNYLFLKQSCIALPFYLIGYQCKNWILHVIRRYNSYGLLAISLALNLVLTTFNGTSSMLYCVFSPNSYPIILSSAIYYINAFIGIFFVLSASTKLMKFKSWFSKISKSLIAIVVFQEFFLSFYITYVGLDQPLIITVSSSVLIVFLCLSLNSFALKYCKWTLGK